MSTQQMKEALSLIDGRAETECSGNVDIDALQGIATLGVDYVSSGALTHSAGILDLSMKHLITTKFSPHASSRVTSMLNTLRMVDLPSADAAIQKLLKSCSPIR